MYHLLLLMLLHKSVGIILTSNRGLASVETPNGRNAASLRPTLGSNNHRSVNRICFCGVPAVPCLDRLMLDLSLASCDNSSGQVKSLLRTEMKVFHVQRHSSAWLLIIISCYKKQDFRQQHDRRVLTAAVVGGCECEEGIRVLSGGLGV